MSQTAELEQGTYTAGFHVPENYTYKSQRGLSKKIVEQISEMKGEPSWMRQFRLKSLDLFEKRPMPTWGADLSGINFDNIFYYIKPIPQQGKSWNDIPAEIKDTFDRLGIPQAEQKYLAGVTAQYESEAVYHKVREDLEKLGVIFTDMDTALREYPDIVKEHFGTVIPASDNKFASLNSAVWSGGSFVYVPANVRVEIPLQAYFRINAKNMGQFERTLIIAEPGSYVHYVEGCTAPTYTSDSLHSAVVEIKVLEGARVRYTTIQNWSKNVYNLVTKRAAAYRDATMEWVDGNLGCLAQGSTVTTPAGTKAIEDLQVGEQVLSYNESTGKLCFRTVNAKRFSGMQPVQTVSIGERKLHVTANHPFFSYTYNPEAARKLGRYRLAYVRADHLKEAIVPRTSIDYGTPYMLEMPSLVTEFASLNQYAPELIMTRSRISRITPITETTDQLMWLFGYWVGDGNIEVAPAQTENVIRYAKVGFSTPATDRARGRLMETMTALIDVVPNERADGHHLSWHSKELAEFFQINGFIGKAINKRVPQWVWSLPESQRLAFIAGYLDADGCVVKGRFSLKSANRGLLEDIASLLVTLGITSRLHTEFDEPRQVEIMGQTCIAHSSHRLVFAADPRFYEHVSETLRTRAQNQAPTQQVNRKVGRSSIELPETVEIVDVKVSEPSEVEVPTWDIEVEGTGNFVSQGFIVHNSKITMKYPAVLLMEPGARGDILSVAFANDGMHQDAGAKVTHLAPHTTSQILSKSVSKGTGRASYRGLVRINPGAHHTKSSVRCDALLLDEQARTDTYPTIRVEENQTEIGHEATVSKVGEDQLFYLMSRGLDESEAYSLIVNGFIEPITKELPMEYAVELNRLIQLEMSGSVG
jgi:Fe-S cluster assembly scaffold protein SufB